MTIAPATRSNGQHPEPLPPRTVTLRKRTEPLATSEGPPHTPPSVPTRDRLLSKLTNRPNHRTWMAETMALVDEQKRIGRLRDRDLLSNMEALVLSKGMASAGQARDTGAAQITQLVEQYQRTEADIVVLSAELARLDDQPVTGMNGENTSAKRASLRMQDVAATVQKEHDAGSLKHRQVPLWLHRSSTWAALLDFPVLLYFVTQVFNVDLAGIASGDGAALGESIVPLLTSIVFALLGTAAVAIGLKFFGRDLKGFKDEHGHIQLPEGKARVIPLLFIGLATLLAIGAGIVMAYRIVADSLAAGNGITSALILGVFFAVIVVAVNVVVFAVHFRDGSLQTDEIGHLNTQVAPHAARRAELHRRIDQLTPELDLLRARAERVYAATLTKMGEAIKAADQLRLLARSYHQGCGAEAELTDQQGRPLRGLLLPDVSLDTSLLDGLLKQMTPKLKASQDANDADAEQGSDATAAGASETVGPGETVDDDLGGEW
ncbi:hypothetical protein [Nocardia asteroides]|uniref:hypothetical protein n=1 Tax=Nocardia asteroides TaxID=1824 RepID=UPI001E46ECEE|nr:hypothetical protein [Nocardia asteroides]UGT62873.1 hypothetical protein LTT61_05915 [Nocardia asteroides]